jgi:hypothetical protein
MSSPSEALKLLGLCFAFYSVVGCGGELIRLGDGNGGSGHGGKSGAAGLVAGAGGFAGTLAGSGGVPALGGAPTAGAGNAQTAAASNNAGDGGAPECPHAEVPANQVVWIGDSWVIYPAGSPQYTFVRDQARAIGAIGASDEYVNLAVAAASMDAIAKQYATEESGPNKVRVLIMDGGTWDPISAQMMGTSVTDAVATAEARFEQFLTEVAADGTVEHIVYFLMPPLSTIPGVDSMRPVLKSACDNSTVPCDFIDLKDAWASHPEYTGASGIQPSAAGATEIGTLIWQTMQANCIAQ